MTRDGERKFSRSNSEEDSTIMSPPPDCAPTLAVALGVITPKFPGKSGGLIRSLDPISTNKVTKKPRTAKRPKPTNASVKNPSRGSRSSPKTAAKANIVTNATRLARKPTNQRPPRRGRSQVLLTILSRIGKSGHQLGETAMSQPDVLKIASGPERGKRNSCL